MSNSVHSAIVSTKKFGKIFGKKKVRLMKSKKNIHSKAGTRLVSIVACFAIAVTVLSFGIFNIGTPGGSSSYAEASDGVGVRFVQVAAGEDFAIGLTYDGQLYGWSTRSDANAGLPSGYDTLGKYYSTFPTKINYAFRRGPGNTNRQVWTSTGSTGYHSTATSRSGEYIIQIAATRTTAAFITNYGYIYTWGYDSPMDVAHDDATDHMLLLRDCSIQTPERANNNYEPYIINYGYYTTSPGTQIPSDSTVGLTQIIPTYTSPTPNMTNLSIAGGEYSYTFMYTTGGSTYVYTWGTMLYETKVTETNINSFRYDNQSGRGQNLSETNTSRLLYRLPSAYGNVGKAVAGGYTVGINMPTPSTSSSSYSRTAHTTSLMLRGKNFITSASVKNSDGTYSVVNTVRTPSPTTKYNLTNIQTETPTDRTDKGANDVLYADGGSDTRYVGALIGARTSMLPQGNYIASAPAGDPGENINNDLVFGRQVVGVTGSADSGDNYDFTNYTVFDGNIYDNYGNIVNNNADGANTNYLSVTTDAVSLGNDIGYGIRGGVLYSWGDNAYGQNGAGTSDSGTGNRDIPAAVLKLASGTNNELVFDVAAGKQLSGEKRAFYSSGTFETESLTDFSDDVKNDANYISGMLKRATSGNINESELWVWSNGNQDPEHIYYGGVDSGSVNFYNQFVKVCSAYGNKLFAITRLGQVVMIEYKNGQYVQTIYDKFGDESRLTAYTNWTIAAETDNVSANFVSFTGGNQAFSGVNDLPDLGTYTVTANNGGIKSDDNVKLNNNGNYSGERNSLVTENRAANVYRIMNPDVDDEGVTTVPTTANTLTTVNIGAAGLSTVKGEPITTFTPKFYWTATGETFNRGTDELTAANVGITVSGGWTKVGNMFEYKFENVNSDANVTGLLIKPLQSTQGGKIKVEFYVGMYATTGEGTERTHVNETQLFFDYQLCTLDFDVLNTAAYKVYEAFDSSGYANIPLLDPNNKYLNMYSVAVQDVSSGIEELSKFFTASGEKHEGLISEIYQKVEENDVGYPAHSRVEPGKLRYYLNSKDLRRFGDNGSGFESTPEYEYLFADRDADRVMIYSTNDLINPENGSGVTSRKATISISVSFEVQYNDSIERITNDVAYKFNNKYGLYDIKITGSDGIYELSFKYDIIRFEATGSTGTLKYGVNNGVNDYATTDATENGKAVFSFNIREYYVFKKDFTVNTNTSEFASSSETGARSVSAFSQPSLIAEYEGVTYYGIADGNNVIRVNRAQQALQTVIGNPSSPIEILLTDFVKNHGNYIMFSYENANNRFGEFNSQFPDKTGTVDSTVELSKNRILVKPMSTARLTFSVTIQRFHTESASKTTFSETSDRFSDDNEKITIYFDFPQFKDYTFAWNSNVSTPTITGDGLFDLLATDPERVNELPYISVQAGDDYKNRIYISQLNSSNTDVLTVDTFANPRQTTKFSFKTKGSGTTVVTFVLSLYDKHILCTLPLSVSAITYINGNIELSDYSIIYVNTLITELRRANSTFADINNYGILYSDPENAVYFTDNSGEVVSTPQWISSISFLDTDPSLSNPRMRIEINESANDMSGEYNMFIRYVDTTKGYTSYEQAETDRIAILETSQRILSSRRIVPGEDGDSILTIRIDTDNVEDRRSQTGSEKTRWYVVGEGDDLEVRIPSAYLLGKIDTPNTEDFQIFLVSAPQEASEYFTYGYPKSKDYVSIRPIRNTPLDEYGVQTAITINVSVNNTLSSSTVEQRKIMTLRISITGISETLSKERYTTIWVVAFFSSFGLLFIIFIIRLIVYWRRRAKQRAIIKRNQELIKLRDRMHNKSSAATREQIVKSKLKMQDPRYAKMVNDMRNERKGAENGGVVVENGANPFAFSEPVAAAAAGGKGKKDKKAKGGKKKSIAELKAELEAKKMAFAQAQNMEPQAPFAGDVGAVPVEGQPFDMGGMGGMGGGAPFGAEPMPDFGSPVDPFAAQDVGAESIIFDAPDNGQV